jgi:hypothetical protein
VSTLKLIREGHITVLPGVAKVSENRVSFDGGKEVLILATGYRPRLDDFLQGASSVLDQEGTPRSTGKESSVPGLYFCGYYVSPTGMLREIAIEARQISAAIASRTNMLSAY